MGFFLRLYFPFVVYFCGLCIFLGLGVSEFAVRSVRDSGMKEGGVRCCVDVSRGFELLFVIRFSLVLVLCAWVVVGLKCVFGTVFFLE